LGVQSLWSYVETCGHAFLDSDETDEESSSAIQDKSMSLSFIANAADDDNDNDDIFGTSFLPFSDNQQGGWSSDDDIIFQRSDDDVDSNSDTNGDSRDNSRDDTDGCASCERESTE